MEMRIEMKAPHCGIPESGVCFVYILACADGTLYTGMTTELARRLREHRQKSARCKFTRRKDKHPLRLGAAWELSGPKGAALTLERRIKKLSRPEKLELLQNPQALSGIMERHAHTLPCQIIPYEGDLYHLEEYS